jgi:DNA topoisomerase-1
MSKNLVIVESPAKAKTIEKYLGKDFHVLSSIGHIRSIVKKTKDGTPPIDVKNGFKTIYEVDPEKKKVIAELKKAIKSVDEVWLATDEDREGEAIAWHLCEVLKLDPKTTKRIVFHEITKSAIEEAMKNPRTINMDIVQAQQARQILDRIVGFELSPVVWQKVPGGKVRLYASLSSVKVKLTHSRHQVNFVSPHSSIMINRNLKPNSNNDSTQKMTQDHFLKVSKMHHLLLVAFQKNLAHVIQPLRSLQVPCNKKLTQS